MDHIIIGYDGSAGSAAAAAWAATEAVRRGASLTAVGCYVEPRDADFSAAAFGTAETPVDLREWTQATVDELAAALAESHPGLTVNGCAVHGRPHRKLAEHAEQASLLVVGSTGATRSAESSIGSVARAVLHDSPCPVVVVPGTRAAAEIPHVVVAIDGGDRSASALQWSIDETDLLGGVLVVVHAWSYPYGDSQAWAEARDIMRIDAAQHLERAVDQARTRGGSKVDRRLVEGHPASAVIAAARDLEPDLIVVGTRERLEGLRFAVLGSVAEAVVDLASCPVAVIRENVQIQTESGSSRRQQDVWP